MDLEAERKKVEKEIQRILIDFENDCDQRIESVDVDTRMYANFKTEIIFVGELF